MITIEKDKISIQLDNCNGLDHLGVLKQSLLSLLVNLDPEHQTTSLVEDIKEVAWLLKSMEFSDDQLTKIQFALNDDRGLRQAFAA